MSKKEENNGGCISTVIGVAILAVIFGGCSACMHNGADDNSNSQPKTHKEAKKKKPTKTQLKKKKEKAFKIKDSQKSMSNDLSDDSLLNKYAYKIKYLGDGEAEIKVTDDFDDLSTAKKNFLAKKFNNLVTSDAEDTGTDADPYSFITFTTRTEQLVGHSKQLDHNVYVWKN